EVFDPANPLLGRLISHSTLESRNDGLLRTALGPMLVSSQPIITSAKEGPIAGTMIMAQFFDKKRLQAVQARTEVAVDWYPADAASALDPPLQAEIVAGAPGSIRYVASEKAIDAYSVLNDLAGNPLVILRAGTPTDTSALGGRAV